MFQAGALWSSMSVGENLMFAQREGLRGDATAGCAGPLDEAELALQARFRLRAGLRRAGRQLRASARRTQRRHAQARRHRARAVRRRAAALLDEPSAGLDPLASARLDALILRPARST